MAINRDCSLWVSVLLLQSRYSVNFQSKTPKRGMNPNVTPAMYQILSLLILYNDGSGIKSPTKVVMPLNKQTKNTTILQFDKPCISYIVFFLKNYS